MSNQPYSGAPYNFVPLPRQPRLTENSVPEADKYNKDRFSGWFDCELLTRTPLYIRNALTRDKYGKKLKREQEKQSKQYTDDEGTFFSPGGMVRLPGSSLRGMIRTLVEIMAESQFLFYSDSRLFFRAVGGQTAQSVVQVYRKRLQVGLHALSLVRAGYMIKQGGQYYIRPAQILNGKTFYQVLIETVQPFAKAPLHVQNRLPEWKRIRVWFKLPSDDKFKPLVREIRSREDNAPKPAEPDWLEGWLVISGSIPKKRHSWIIPEIDKAAAPVPVPLEVVQAYRDEGGITPAIENSNFSVLPEQSSEVWPCFYLERLTESNQKEVSSFGHTGYFRLPYEHTVGDVIRQTQSQEQQILPNQLDLTQAIFGQAADKKKKNSTAGRVFFEDAQPIGTVRWETNEPVPPQILSAPKPTTFQHYLEQTEAAQYKNPADRMRNLHFWDKTGATIRGYKLYWHRRDAEWRAKDGEVKEKPQQYTLIQPLAANNTFRFRIRFENLNELEIGVLAAALDLPSECAHKLGMGKPLGLGSVRITATLSLVDRFQRYSRLFASLNGDKGEWEIGQPKTQKQITDLTYYKDKFAAWLTQIPTTRLNDVWKERWRDLYALLNWEDAPSADITRYMEIEHKDATDLGKVVNEYKSREVLLMAHQLWEKHRVKVNKPSDLVADAEGDINTPASTEDLNRLFQKYNRNR